MWHRLSLPCSCSLKQTGAPGAALHGQQRGAPSPWGVWTKGQQMGVQPPPKFGVAAGNAEVFGGIWELRQFPALWLWLQFVMVVAAATNVPSDALRHLLGLWHWELHGVN